MFTEMADNQHSSYIQVLRYEKNDNQINSWPKRGEWWYRPTCAKTSNKCTRMLDNDELGYLIGRYRNIYGRDRVGNNAMHSVRVRFFRVYKKNSKRDKK